MRVMYLTIEGFDTPNANNHLAQTLIKGILDAGKEVYLVQSHRTGEYSDIPDDLVKYDTLFADIVDRPVIDKGAFVSRYFEGVSYAFKCMKKWRKQRKRIDVVILQATPTSWLTVLLMKVFMRKPIIFSIFDVFPNGAYAFRAIDNKLIYSALHLIQRIVYKLSDKIVVISSDMEQQLINEGIPKDKIETIVNWYDESKIAEVPKSKNRFIQKYSINDSLFHVQYAGNFGYTFDYKMFLDVAERCKDYTHIHFDLIGAGGFLEIIESEVKTRKLDNITFYPWQPLEIISDVYSACDIQFIPLSPGVIGNSYPSKASLVMACGRSFVTTADTSTFYARDISEAGIGICVSDKSPDDAATAIISMYKTPEELAEMQKRALAFVKEKYGSANNVNKFIMLIDNIK